MKYAIVVSSITGNTRKLAEKISEVLQEEDKNCVYCGGPSDEAIAADVIFAGSWTDKGTCSEEIAEFLKKCSGKKIFLFGTAGFGGGKEYFERILQSVRKLLPDKAEEVGSFMCQGKMPESVRLRYEQMPGLTEERRQAMLDNFDQALSHPDDQDLLELHEQVMTAVDVQDS